MADGRLHRQPLPLLAAVGLLLPAIIALAVWFYSNQDQRRADVERTALQTARQMIELTDVELEANMRTLALLADSPTLASSDFSRWRGLIERTMRQTPGWRGIVLRRSDAAAPILEASMEPDGRPLRPLPQAVSNEGTIEGVLREGRYCPCVILHRRAAENPGLVITLYLDPQLFQDIMRAKTPAGRVGAIVDQRAHFAARSMAYDQRVGTPATPYVRRAAARGGNSFYRGVTFEGLANYSAYATSPETGWSAHEAVDRSTIDSARTWSNAATAIGILAALALAAGLALYGIYEMRSRRRDEERFLEMQKSETISRFTGTVVHDFRNILAVVEAGLNLISRQRTKAQMEKTIREVRDTLARGERLTNQLLSFVRGDGAEIRTVDLKALMEGSEELLRGSLGDDIDFNWKVADDARYARANPDQLELALLNLAINARDALAGPGRFTITTERERDRVVIAASDNGPGIPPHRRDEVFELYVSTKPAGKGTGLGLAQVEGAMRQAEGRVKVVDNPGGGARFLLSLKAGAPPKDPDEEPGEAPPPATPKKAKP
jgi:signal transduction histidine kinase